MTTLDSQLATPETRVSSPRRSLRPIWAGRALSGLGILFLSWDAALKLIGHPMAVESTVALGYSAQTVFTIGVIAAACVVLYAMPRTSVVGAVLFTGYLGGAVASQVRVGNPLFSHTLFPIYVAVLLWGGLVLRDPRLVALFQRGSRESN